MANVAKTYTLREESTESGTKYFISFKDGQGEHHKPEVSEQLFFEFRQMERRNREQKRTVWIELSAKKDRLSQKKTVVTRPSSHFL